MANPTIHIDGDKKRIYEVPNLSSFVVDGNGFRIYTPDSLIGRVNEFVNLSFQVDIWSRFQDWHQLNEWSTIGIGRTGGASRGIINAVEVFASNDYQILTSADWAFVPADYPHVLEIFGNVLADQANTTIFDTTRITAIGVSQNIRMADSLQVAVIASGSGLDSGQDIKLTEVHRAHFNKRTWDKNGNTVTVFDTDGTTPLHVFDVNSDLSEITPQ